MDESVKTERAPDTGARSVGRYGPQNQTLKRDAGYDHIKALLIYLMVLGHLLTRFGDGAAADGLYLLIFSFHMPAFLFVSGYFARGGPDASTQALLERWPGAAPSGPFPNWRRCIWCSSASNF